MVRPRITGFGRTASSGTSELDLAPEEIAALQTFSRDLKVKRDTSSRLISVSFASHDPKLAATVTNGLAELFIDQGYQTRHDSIMKSSEWLSRQLDDLRAKMDDSTKALAEFQRAVGVADAEGDKSTFSEHMGEADGYVQFKQRRKEFNCKPCLKTCRQQFIFASRSPQ